MDLCFQFPLIKCMNNFLIYCNEIKTSAKSVLEIQMPINLVKSLIAATQIGKVGVLFISPLTTIIIF